MTKISPYMRQIPRFGYIKPPKYNLELELQVLQHKQNTYNRNYQHLQNLKAQALNINFINKEAKSKVDSFNEEISNSFDSLNGDFGDLSNNNLAQRYTQMFDKFQDENLIGLYKKETEYVDTLKDINKRKKSKNPSEAGYNIMNEMVYRMDLENYSKLSLDEAKDSTVSPYVPFVDVGKLQQEALLKIPEVETIREVTDSKTGRKTIIKTKGRDTRAAAQISKQINSQNYQQFNVQAKYLYNSGVLENPEILQSQVSQYNNKVLEQRFQVQQERERLNTEYKGKEKDEAYYDRNQQIENTLADLKTYDLKDLDENKLVSIISNNISSDVSRGAIRAYAPQSQSVTTELDDVYRFGREMSVKLANLSLAQEKFEHTKRNDAALIQLKTAELELEGLQINSSNPNNITGRNELGFIGGMETSDATTVFTPEQVNNLTEIISQEVESIMVANHDFDKGSLKLEGTVFLDSKYNEIIKFHDELVATDPLYTGSPGGSVQSITSKQDREKMSRLIKSYELSKDLTKEKLINQLIENPKVITSDPKLAGNADVLAYREAIADLQRGGKNIELTTRQIEEQVKKIKDDSSSDYSLQKERLNRYYNIIKRQLGEISVNDSDFKERIKTLTQSPNVQHYLYRGTRIDLQGKTKKDLLNQQIAKNLLSNNTILGENTTLNIDGIKPSDLASVQYHENGQTTITFDDEYLVKAKKAERPLIIEVKNLDGTVVPVDLSQTGQVTFYSGKPKIFEEFVASLDTFDTTKVHKVAGTDITYTINPPSNGRVKVHITKPDGTTFIERFDASMTNTELQQSISAYVNLLNSYGGKN